LSTLTKAFVLARNGDLRQSGEIRGNSGENFMAPQEAPRAKKRSMENICGMAKTGQLP
jgi:hypothetical protein